MVEGDEGRGGKLVFDDEDVLKSDDMLKATLVKIFVDKKITYKKFIEAHREYMLSLGVLPKQIVSNRNNLIKSLLLNNTLTYKRFETILRNILKLNLVNVSLTFKDTTNHEYFVKMDRMTY